MPNRLCGQRSDDKGRRSLTHENEHVTYSEWNPIAEDTHDGAEFFVALDWVASLEARKTTTATCRSIAAITTNAFSDPFDCRDDRYAFVCVWSREQNQFRLGSHRRVILTGRQEGYQFYYSTSSSLDYRRPSLIVGFACWLDTHYLMQHVEQSGGSRFDRARQT